MSESGPVVQFVEMIRSAMQGKGDLIAWLGDRESVAHGAMPAAVLDNVCPACHTTQPHLVQSMGNWDQFRCLVCGFRHSQQLTKGERHG